MADVADCGQSRTDCVVSNGWSVLWSMTVLFVLDKNLQDMRDREGLDPCNSAATLGSSTQGHTRSTAFVLLCLGQRRLHA